MHPEDHCPIEIPNFRIKQLLGRGGMGRVFLAEQQQPRRPVVIKVVASEAIHVTDPEIRARVIERLRHEGDIAARFQHPNLVTVFECGIIDDHYYLAMEYLSGGDLRQRLTRPMDPAVAAAITAKIASGLAAMHRLGLLHRDLKPENILLRENGEPVLVDFGIAKDPEQPSGLTDLGVRSGTVHYMSPEQLEHGATEPRSDLYSLGVVLYEMLVGRVPFDGARAEVERAHREALVPPLPDNLADYQPIVNQLLAKELAARYPSAEAVEHDLLALAATDPALTPLPRRRRARAGRWWPVAAAVLVVAAAAGWWPADAPDDRPAILNGGGERASVAVLPFVNMSADPDNAYFSDGISEEILNTLARLNGLRVPARSSSFQFKGENHDVRAVADALGVRHVLEGSVRKQGQRIRVTAQLVDARSGYQLWSDTWERRLVDVFAIQDEIARAVTEAVSPRLLGELQPSASAGNMEAYDLFLLGRHYVRQRNRESLDRARGLFRQATTLDPDFALARVGLAEATILLLDSKTTYGDLPLATVNSQAGAALQRAEALAPQLAEVHATRGLLKIVNGDYPGAVTHLSRALELKPNLAVAYMWRGTTLGFLGHYRRCLADLETAREVDPLSPAVAANLIWANHLAGSEDRTDRLIEDTLARYPEFLLAWGNAGNVRYMQGRAEEARAFYRQANVASPSYRLAADMLGIIALDKGDFSSAEIRLEGAGAAWLAVARGRLEEAWQVVRDYPSADPDTLSYVAAATGRFEAVLALLDGDGGNRLPGALLDGSTVSNLGRLPALTVAFALQRLGQVEAAAAVRAQAAAILRNARDAGASSPGLLYAEGVLQALEGDPGAADTLRASIAAGWRSWWYLAHDPRLTGVLDDPDLAQALRSITPVPLPGRAVAMSDR